MDLQDVPHQFVLPSDPGRGPEPPHTQGLPLRISIACFGTQVASVLSTDYDGT
jgi:hypothetical protein